MEMKTQKTDAEWRAELSPEQYEVLRRKSTERAFTGEYVDTKDPGVYRCAGCGAELFRSDAKFHSGSGWPSFVEPSSLDSVEEIVDTSQRRFVDPVRGGDLYTFGAGSAWRHIDRLDSAAEPVLELSPI